MTMDRCFADSLLKKCPLLDDLDNGVILTTQGYLYEVINFLKFNVKPVENKIENIRIFFNSKQCVKLSIWRLSIDKKNIE